MNFKHVSLFTMLILGIFLTSCEKDDTDLTPDPNEKQGKLELSITDAPVDDPAVKNVFVAIADVKIDGQSMPGFSPVAFDLLTLQNGITALLASDSVKSASYSEVTLILDPSECYVEDIDGNRHNLDPDDVNIKLNHEFDVLEDSVTHLLVDFDLRKTIRRDLSDSTDRYNFVSGSDLASGVRIFDKSVAGQLTGECKDISTGSELIVAYLYEKGEFEESTEVDLSDESNLRFKNAVSSAMVMVDGKYNFPFLESGEYELHLASYLENDSSGVVEFRGLLEVEADDMQDVLNISIESFGKTEIDIAVVGLLPL